MPQSYDERGSQRLTDYYRHLLGEEGGDHDAAERRRALSMIAETRIPPKTTRLAAHTREYVIEMVLLGQRLIAVLGHDQTVAEFPDPLAAWLTYAEDLARRDREAHEQAVLLDALEADA